MVELFHSAFPSERRKHLEPQSAQQSSGGIARIVLRTCRWKLLAFYWKTPGSSVTSIPLAYSCESVDTQLPGFSSKEHGGFAAIPPVSAIWVARAGASRYRWPDG